MIAIKEMLALPDFQSNYRFELEFKHSKILNSKPLALRCLRVNLSKLVEENIGTADFIETIGGEAFSQLDLLQTLSCKNSVWISLKFYSPTGDEIGYFNDNIVIDTLLPITPLDGYIIEPFVWRLYFKRA